MCPGVGDNCSVVPSRVLTPLTRAQVAHPSSSAEQNHPNYFPLKRCTSALLAVRVIQGNVLICEAGLGGPSTGAVQVSVQCWSSCPSPFVRRRAQGRSRGAGGLDWAGRKWCAVGTAVGREQRPGGLPWLFLSRVNPFIRARLDGAPSSLV